MSLGILSDPTLPLPYLLDAINHAEVGHLPRAKQLTAVSDRGAQGPYQFLTKNLHDMGYGMPRDIPVSDITNYNTARDLAGQYVTGYSEKLGFKTPLEQLVAYTAGPQFAANWVARGANIEELGPRTQSYIKRAADYLQNVRNNDMAILGMPSEDDGNVTIAGDVINPDLPALMAEKERIDGMIRSAIAASPAQVDQDAGLSMAMPNPRVASGSTSVAPVAPIMAMPSETDATQNIDGTQVGEDAILNQVGESLTGVLTDITGANSQPRNAPQPSTPALSVYPNQIGITAPALASTTQPALTYSPSMPAQQPPITAPGGVAQNRRDNSVMSLARPRQGNINDLMIAMGSAGLRGSAEGGLQALAGMGEAYTAYQAAQQDAIAKYNQSLAKAAGKSKSKGAPQQSPYTPVVLSAIDRIEGRVSEASDDWINPFDNVTGMTGSMMSIVPGSPAYDTAMDIETIVSSIGFDRLQAMRDASPTGGALGQVSERELSQLNASLGNLRQSQSRENFLVNLRAVRRHYQAAVEAIRAQQVEYARMNGLPVPPHPNDPGASMSTGAPTGTGNSNLSAADAIVGIN